MRELEVGWMIGMDDENGGWRGQEKKRAHTHTDKHLPHTQRNVGWDGSPFSLSRPARFPVSFFSPQMQEWINAMYIGYRLSASCRQQLD